MLRWEIDVLQLIWSPNSNQLFLESQTMNRPFRYLTLAVLALSHVSLANASEELARTKNCLSCHQIGAKLIGPSYLDVAKKYASDKDAEAKIIKQIAQGGGGQWGKMRMPPQPQVGADEAKQIAKWILSLNK